ncbi:MAG: MG2 domain-containing protein [Methylophilaceae bacterium]
MKYLVKTIAVIFILLNAGVAQADDGAGFFILADRSYSSQEQAQVRLEMQDVNEVHQNAGVDIAVYKVAKPIAFLQSQKNLHRISTKAQPAQTGVWNSIIAIWDYVGNSARRLARLFFSEDARQTTVETAPDLHVAKINHPATHPAVYQPLEGYEQVGRFRYPLQYGKDVKQADAVLSGANIEGNIDGFQVDGQVNGEVEGNGQAEKTAAGSAPFSNGNVYVPVGKLPPGLYIVEAMLGDQRAVTMLFVGNTVAVTKTSPAGLFVWAVDRTTGAPVANVDSHWTDGIGELASGVTNAQGWLQLNHAASEQTYLFAQDAQGGVLISENFYYNSEIYNTKLYATTDHPLYRPGDMVNIKVVGREFINARESKPLVDAPIKVTVLDPNGLPVANQTLQFSGSAGGDTTIKLPAGSVAGGYDIQMTYLGEVYSAAFRVSEFKKPHFEINVVADKGDLKTNQLIPLEVQLRYPDGKPVKNAEIDIDLKAQALSMVEGDLGYSGQFPIKLTSQKYQTDASGNVNISLPEVKVPSRYILSTLATDGAAYRVRNTQEFLIERAKSGWKVNAPSRFTMPDTAVHFNVNQQASAQLGNAKLGDAKKPSQWKWVRLEDQSTDAGKLTADVAQGFDVKFNKSGSYTVSVLSEDGALLGATSHWVSGADLKVPAGHIEVVWDKTTYQVGETATALVSFSEPIDHALLTLERDKIEKTSLLNAPDAWIKTSKIAPQQWRVSLPVTETFAPNVTLSVAYVHNNDFVFENAGIIVSSPKVNVRVTADKKQYAPGDTVKLSIDTAMISANGQATQKPVSAQVTLGVVDEMIYVLQPEIAPNIHDFFYHPRRNNVRTQYSQSFIGYDLSTNQLGVAPNTHSTHERATKVLERPRRDDVDTALWAPKITTDANGHAEITFKMPDSLTRWRMTARAMTNDGVVGQSVSDVMSYKDYYLKWTSPNWLRSQDVVTGNIAVFNQTNQSQKVHVSLKGAITQEENITLNPGINFMEVPRTGEQSGEVTMTLTQNDKVLDSLAVNLSSMADSWQTHFNKLVMPVDGKLALNLPTDASNINLRWLDSARAGFYRVVDDLTEYPYGCVEQTASRLIPLALAYQSLAVDDPRRTVIMRQLYTHRLRLASMAGPEAQFGWWGQDMVVDPFITTYAYYADWRTAQALQLDLPADHWERLTKLYSESGFEQDVWKRALMLDWMTQIGLPTQSMVSNLAADLAKDGAPTARKYGQHDSLVLSEETSQTRDLAIVLTSKLLKSSVEGFNAQVSAAVARVKMQDSLVAKALLNRTGYEKVDVDSLLSLASADTATIDRALMLTWVDASKGDGRVDKVLAMPLAKPWIAYATATGGQAYRWPAASTPKVLNEPIVTSLNAVVSYDSAAVASKSTLPAKLVRTLMKIGQQKDGSFTEEAVDQNAPLSTDTLYLETIELTPTAPMHYVVIEAALPAGAQVESGTWGIKVGGEDLPKANFQDLTGRYAVPVGNVDKVVRVQHLLRFSQRGQYTLPPARAYNMYSPDAIVLESQVRKSITVK